MSKSVDGWGDTPEPCWKCFLRGLSRVGVERLKPLQDSAKSLFCLLFDPDSTPQVDDLFEESFAFVEKGGGKAVGPEGEFREEVDPSQGSDHDALEIELLIKIPKALLNPPAAGIHPDHSFGLFP